MKAKDRQNDLPMMLTVSRIHGDTEYIEVRIIDGNSRMDFVTVRLELDDFTNCITGLANTKCIGEVGGLDRVGKQQETDQLEFEMPAGIYDGRVGRAIELAEDACPEGWQFDSHFNSQSSFFTRDEKSYARTTIRRWV